MLLKPPVKFRHKRLKQREVAQLLQLTEGRVSQLVSSGELTDLSVEGVQAFTRARQERERQRREYKERQDEARRREHNEMLTELRGINEKLALLIGVTGADAVANALARKG